MMHLFEQTCSNCSKLLTQQYSTSFSLGIKTLHRQYRQPVYNIYGFVRLADEIVDTFHAYNRAQLLERFRQETYVAIEEKISLNPILQAFQQTVHRHRLNHSYIDAFLKSMSMDLSYTHYEDDLYQKYIYGSAEVVGLLCLQVFCNGEKETFRRLEQPARKLGAAFQKVNFLRDMQSDFYERGRIYFPQVDFSSFDGDAKAAIEADIQQDFEAAYRGIVQLPGGARLGVYLAYIYYLRLFRKIKGHSPKSILQGRIRVPDPEKAFLLMQTYIRHKLNFL